MTQKDELFTEAAKQWDLDRLYKALSEAKKQVAPKSKYGLTTTEKLYLRGILCGCSPADIARKLSRVPKGGEVYVCKTLYVYVKSLVDAPQEPLKNWRTICELLEPAGYKAAFDRPSTPNNHISLLIDPLVTIVDMGFENPNTLTIDINIKLKLPPNLTSE